MFKTKVNDYGWQNIGQLDSLRFLFPVIKKILRKIMPETILDFGCGDGRFTRQIHDLGFEITGCDVDAKAIQLAQKANDGIAFFQLRETDPLNDAIFDVMLAIEVIEHMFIPSELLVYAQKHLTHNGYLIITTPYHGYLKNLAIATFNFWDKHHHPLRDGGHIKFWSKRTIGQLLSQNGFKIKTITGVGRIPFFWKSMVIVSQWIG